MEYPDDKLEKLKEGAAAGFPDRPLGGW